MRKFTITVLLFLLTCTVFAQTNGQIDFNIRFYNKKVYYIQSASNDPIEVQVTITNNGSAPYYFKLAEDREFSVDFNVLTTTNLGLEQTDDLLRRRSQSKLVYSRVIAVEQGESFSFVEDIRTYVYLKDAGTFIVQAKLYPELYQVNNSQTVNSAASSASTLLSNRLTLNIRPQTILGPDGLPTAMDVETNAVLVREKLSPDKVIEYMITARQKSQWEKFFLYLDLETMYRSDGVRNRQWQGSSEEARQQLLARYREELQQNKVDKDKDIVTIPERFEIQRTNYGINEGTVTVLEWFRGGNNYVDKKQYVYNIQRKDDIWMVVNYTVQNLGTE